MLRMSRLADEVYQSFTPLQREAVTLALRQGSPHVQGLAVSQRNALKVLYAANGPAVLADYFDDGHTGFREVMALESFSAEGVI